MTSGLLTRTLPQIGGASERARSKIARYRQVSELRRAGLAIAWNTDLQWDERGTLVFGRGCKVGRHSMVVLGASASSDRTGSLSLGDQVQIGEYNNIRPGDCHITIGSRVLFSQFVSVIASNHLVHADGRISWDEIEPHQRDVTIGDECWIGTQAVILPGVTLAARTIVGAGAVVTKSFPQGARLAGVPARAL